MPYFKWLFTQKTKGREGGWNVPEKVVEQVAHVLRVQVVFTKG